MVRDIGIDLGTYKTVVYVKNYGIVFEEPSVIAYNLETNEVVAVGKGAYEMIGKTPSYIKVIKPISNGVVYDYKFLEKMIFNILKKISCFKFFNFKIIKPRVAICVPSIVTDIEKNAVIDVALSLGARKVFIIEEPIAAALGEGVDISKPKGRLIVDIGAGSADMALLSLNGVVVKNSVRIAGDNFDEVVIKIIKEKYNLEIGINSAMAVKEKIGSVGDHNNYNSCMIIKGKDLITGLPKQIEVNSDDFKKEFNLISDQIILEIKKIIENTPPDLLSDIQNEFLLMTGGTSKLKGLKEKVEDSTKLKVFVSETATRSVAVGVGACFDYINKIDDGVIKKSAYKI